MKTQLNIEFMKKVRDRIKEVGPEHCDMGSFIDLNFDVKALEEPITIRSRGRVDCGTTACIAGWTLAVKNGSFSEDDIDSDDAFMNEACKALGLPNTNLFFTHAWPQKFQKSLRLRTEQEVMVEILDALISGELDPNWTR